MELDLDNREFKLAYDLILNTNKSFFLTGKAGTGKSTFLQYFVKNIAKRFVVVAPTGIAAINARGMTIHSFFQFPPRPFIPNDPEITIFVDGSFSRKIFEELDTLFIDEISMVRIDLLHAIDYSLKMNGGNPNLPFGGKQVVFIGDVFQLPPIVKKETGEQRIIHDFYGGNPFFFNLTIFKKNGLLTIELKKVYRQSDLHFINLLDNIRVAKINPKEIEKLNSRVMSNEDLDGHDFVVTLTTRNDIANQINSAKLLSLEAKEFIYNAELRGEFDPTSYPADPKLILKVGAQVIFVKNDLKKRWVNGTIGQVVKLSKKRIKVMTENGMTWGVGLEQWENIKYKFNKDTSKIDKEIIGTFKQYPLKLAWAVTIHKSQGLTFEKVVVDLGSGTFASGQAYVGLSRVTSLNGLFLKRKITAKDIFVDQEIIEFAKSFKEIPEDEQRQILERAFFEGTKNADTEDKQMENQPKQLLFGFFPSGQC